jgi:hypothetical protein
VAKLNQTEILAQVIELLTPLNSEERQRIVQASLTFLGEKSTGLPTRLSSDITDGEEDVDLPIRARGWLKQNGILIEQIQQVLHLSSGQVEVIASDIPGSSTKERTVNAYVLAGLAKFLLSGEMKFDDKFAREVCAKSGCFDATNHSTYLKGRGNLFTGTKDAGWALTAPGLKQAAELIKTLTRSRQ